MRSGYCYRQPLSSPDPPPVLSSMRKAVCCRVAEGEKPCRRGSELGEDDEEEEELEGEAKEVEDFGAEDRQGVVGAGRDTTLEKAIQAREMVLVSD